MKPGLAERCSDCESGIGCVHILLLLETASSQQAIQHQSSDSLHDAHARFVVTHTALRSAPAALIASPVSSSVRYDCAVSMCRIPSLRASAPVSTAFFPAAERPPVPFPHATAGMDLPSLSLMLRTMVRRRREASVVE